MMFDFNVIKDIWPIFSILIFVLLIIIVNLIIISLKEICEYILKKMGYYTSIEYGVPDKVYWRRSYTKEFHFDFFNRYWCHDGYIRFGTYYRKYANGYHSYDSIKKPKLE